MLKMLIGCLLPIVLIFVLPLFGVDEGVTLAIFLVLMLGCHLLLTRGHGKHDKKGHDHEHAEH